MCVCVCVCVCDKLVCIWTWKKMTLSTWDLAVTRSFGRVREIESLFHKQRDVTRCGKFLNGRERERKVDVPFELKKKREIKNNPKTWK